MTTERKLENAIWYLFDIWSEWRDLNPRPLRPERSALPD